MNQDVFTGQWKQIRGELKSWWGKLANDDLERIGGRKDKLIGVLQEKYGYDREQAKQEVERRLQEYDDTTHSPNGSGRRDTAEAGAGGLANVLHEGPIATAVAAVAGGLESAEDAFATGWESAEGVISTATTAVEGGLESASSYLQEKKFAEIASDLTDLIRHYPVQSLLVGVGLGYVLARLTKR